MNQIEWVYNQLQSLSIETLVRVIDELGCEIPDNAYKKMATDVYNKAKSGQSITHKQKRVLVNIIGQPPRLQRSLLAEHGMTEKEDEAMTDIMNSHDFDGW